MVNKHKSSLIFSSNTRDGIKWELVQATGGIIFGSQDRYLGLPTLIGRSKYKTFIWIKEEVWPKVSNWKHRFLSQAGREVLIKVVLQVIPVYIMSVFQLPQTLCNELEMSMANFWQRMKENEPVTHQMSQKRMGKPKKVGGLGFRNLQCFNMVLLAKQLWRLVTHLESLATRILRENYRWTGYTFPDKAKPFSSPLWKSLLSAKELVEKGSRWRVGNGHSIKILQYMWLPIPRS